MINTIKHYMKTFLNKCCGVATSETDNEPQKKPTKKPARKASFSG